MTAGHVSTDWSLGICASMAINELPLILQRGKDMLLGLHHMCFIEGPKVWLHYVLPELSPPVTASP